jgi:hypothetical protein
VAKILQAVVARVLKAVGFDGWMERSGIKQFFDRAQTRQTPATILGKLVFWFVFIIAITMATDVLGIREVSAVFSQLIAYIPNIIAAVLILILAGLLANFEQQQPSSPPWMSPRIGAWISMVFALGSFVNNV